MSGATKQATGDQGRITGWVFRRREPPRARHDLIDLVRGMRDTDWLFAALTFFLLWYALYNLFRRERDADAIVDIMLLFGGSSFLCVGWWVSRIGERVSRMLDELDGIGAVTFDTEQQREDVRTELTQVGNRLGLRWMFSVAIVEVVAIAGAVAQGLDLIPALILAVFCVLCSGFAGLRFGQFYAYGHLFGILKKYGQNLRAGGDLLIRAIAPLRSLYGAGTVAAMLLCLYFVIWQVIWIIDPAWAKDLRQLWERSFQLLGCVGIGVVLLLGLVPVRRFQLRIDDIYGSSAERAAAVSRQRSLADEDLRNIQARMTELSVLPAPASTDAAELAELRARRSELSSYRDGLAGRTRGDWVMRPTTIVVFAVVVGIIIVVPAALGFLGHPLSLGQGE